MLTTILIGLAVGTITGLLIVGGVYLTHCWMKKVGGGCEEE